MLTIEAVREGRKHDCGRAVTLGLLQEAGNRIGLPVGDFCAAVLPWEIQVLCEAYHEHRSTVKAVDVWEAYAEPEETNESG